MRAKKENFNLFRAAGVYNMDDLKAFKKYYKIRTAAQMVEKLKEHAEKIKKGE